MGILILILVGLLGYRLSDSMTIDEYLWLNRFNGYAVNMVKEYLTLFHLWRGEANLGGMDSGGMSTRLWVGLPGTALSLFFGKEGLDRLIVYRSIQVAEFVLLLGIYFWRRSRYLDVSWIWALALLLAMPIIRGMARVINYDTFVSLFSLLSLLEYYLFSQQNEERKHRTLAILFCTLAMMTKLSGIYVFCYLIFCETLRCARIAIRFNPYVRLWIKETASFTLITLFFFLLLMPNAWIAPSSVRPFVWDLTYLIVERSPLFLTLVGISLLGLGLGAWKIRRWILTLPKLPRPLRLSLSYGLPGLLLFSALFFQSDRMMAFDGFDVEALTTYLKQHSLYFSRTSVHPFTYLQGYIPSVFINGFNAVKILLFTTPLPILLLSLLGIYTYRRDWIRYWLGFMGLYLVIYAGMMIPPIHRYLLPCHYVIVMLAVAGMTSLIQKWPYRRIWLNTFWVICLVPQIFAAFPTDLAYSNILRNRNIDDSFELARQGSEGLWSGWGEHFLPVVDYLNLKPHAETLTVLFDYRFPRNFKGKTIYGNAFECGDCVNVDYFVMSKTIWFRDAREMEYIQNVPPEMIFRINGVRYAYLYRAPLPLSKPGQGFPLPTLK